MFEFKYNTTKELLQCQHLQDIPAQLRVKTNRFGNVIFGVEREREREREREACLLPTQRVGLQTYKVQNTKYRLIQIRHVGPKLH